MVELLNHRVKQEEQLLEGGDGKCPNIISCQK
jgi:hypothetical protein